MKKETARFLLMDYLYDEISDDDRRRLEAYLSEHPEMKQELNQLGETRNLLQQMPETQPNQQMVMVGTGERSFGQWLREAGNLLPQTVVGRTLLAAAAGLLLFIIIGSVSKMNLTVNESGFNLSMGYEVQEQTGLTEAQAAELIDQIRTENATMMARYAESIQQEHQVQLQQVVRYFNQQRLNDLELIDQNLEQIHQANNYQWLQTNDVLGDLIQNVSLRNSN